MIKVKRIDNFFKPKVITPFTPSDHAFRTSGIRATHGVLATESFQSNGGIEKCSTQSPGLQLSGSVFDARLCATDGTQMDGVWRCVGQRVERVV